MLLLIFMFFGIQMFSTGLLLAFAGMCLCQQQQSSSVSPLQYQSAVSQASYHSGSAGIQQSSQTKLEDIERDSLVADFSQKTQQPTSKSISTVPQQQSYQSAAQSQQYFMQPYQAQQQFYVQPYQAQPYQMAFDYAGVQYMIVPSMYSSNQVYQPYYVPSAPQPSAVPQYVSKQQSSPATAQSQQDYKQQLTASAQTQQDYKTQYVSASPAYQYVQQQSAAAIASPVDYSYITRHPSFKVPATSAAIQPQYQYSAVPQQYPLYQQSQYYYTLPVAQSVGAEQPRIQQSLKSQYSSGVKSTTPFPLQKEAFSYKFESSPLTQQQQQQQSSATYSTLKYSA